MAIMAVKPVPYQCIWCLKYPSSATFFNSESHVLPECIGNIDKQVLPKGIVCDKCNNYFSGELEDRLIEEPILNTLVAILRLRDPDSQFAYERSPSGVHRHAHMAAEVSAAGTTITTHYEIEGQPNKPSEVRTITKSKNYGRRGLAFLSRAVHKIAFETVAHNLFVGTGVKQPSKEIGGIDIFDPSFNVTRDWVLWGKPQHPVRPALRIQRFDEVERQEQLWEWGGRMWPSRDCICYELNLFHDWYIVSLTSPANMVKGDLMSWLKKRKPNHQVWMLGDKPQLVQ
jgi:hypothetical protein